MNSTQHPITANWKLINKMIAEGKGSEVKQLIIDLKEKVDKQCNKGKKRILVQELAISGVRTRRYFYL